MHPSLPTFYRAFVKLLWRRGRCQRAEQTAREFLGDVADGLGLPRGQLAELADLLYQIRWGRQKPSAAALARARQTVQHISQLLGAGRPAWARSRQPA